MVLPSLISFGSLTGVSDQEYLSSISSLLLKDEHTTALVDIINTLPEWWNDIAQSHKVLQGVPGHAALERLRQWLTEGAQYDRRDPTPNIILVPLTIFTHLVEYFTYIRSGRVRHIDVVLAAQTSGFQGLCVGQLTATVLASSKDENEIIQQAGVAIRLAVLIGAIVDLDGCYAETPKEWASLVACSKADLPLNTVSNVLAAYTEVCFFHIMSSKILTDIRPMYQLYQVCHE